MNTKRLLDVVISAVLLILLSPLMLLISVLVLLDVGGPVLFRQLRPGLNARPFELIKFRTMHELRSANGEFLADEQRLTRFGAFLRKTSLDELPSLWSVVRGHMSLVGPRPLLIEYLPLYSDEQSRRHEVRPGVTGWAQVNGRNAISWGEKLALDVWYVDHRSFWLDMRILWLTVLKVFQAEGISQPGQATIQKFTGNDGR